MSAPKSLLDRWRQVGLAIRDSRLDDNALAVLWAVLDGVDPESGRARPSLDAIAQALGISRLTVLASIEDLVRWEYLQWGVAPEGRA